MRIDLPKARATLKEAASRTAELLASIPDGQRPVKKSEWTIGETGAHLVFGLRGFTDAVQGSYDSVAPYIPDTEVFRPRLSAVTAGTLELVPERQPWALATLVMEAAEKFLAVTNGHAPDEPVGTPWYGSHTSLSLAQVTGLLAGEQIIHGYDIATTVRRHWPISQADAVQTLLVVATGMIPKAVNPRHRRQAQRHLRGAPAGR